jgi:urease accessory protein
MTLLRLLQLTDSGFPTGSYAFSHGLECLHAMGLIRGQPDVRAFALGHIQETLAGQDLPAVVHAHRAATTGTLDALIALDTLLDALRPVPAHRTASTRIGRQSLQSAFALYPSAIAGAYLAAIRAQRARGHHAVAFGVLTASAGIEFRPAVSAFGASSLGSYVAAAVRLGVIGQGAAQRVIAELEPDLAAVVAKSPEIALDDLGGYTPLIDIAGMRQPHLATRIFSS